MATLSQIDANRRNLQLEDPDASGGSAVGKPACYETGLVLECARSRQELEKLQKIRAATPTPAPVTLV